MGVDTKGVVLTEKKDIFEVVRRVEKAICNLQKEISGKRGYKIYLDSDKFTFPTTHFTSSSGYVITSFMVDGEDRNLSIFTETGYDYDEEFGECGKIVFNLGYWGMSIEIITIILKELSQIGECYILRCDANDEWEQI